MVNPFFEVAHNHNFRSLWLGQIISQVALNLLSFVLAIQVYQETYSNTAVSLMLLTFALPAILFGLISGSIVDKLDKKSVLVFCNLSRGFILLGYFVTTSSLFFLYFWSVVISLLTQLFIPAEAPSIPQLVKKDNLLTANSLFTITFYLSTVLGTVSAGPFLKIFGIQTIFLIMSGLMFTASLFTLRLPSLQAEKKFKFSLNLKSISEPIWEGLTFIRQHSRIRRSLFLMTFSQALISTLAVLAPGFADKILKIDIKDVSLLVMGPSAVGLIAGAYLVGILARKLLKGMIILSGIITAGSALILLSIFSFIDFPSLFIIIAFLLFIIGMSNSFINVPSSTILQLETEARLRGRIYGVLTSLTAGISILPVLLSGILADTVGISKTLLFIGLVVFLAGIYYLSQRREFSRL